MALQPSNPLICAVIENKVDLVKHYIESGVLLDTHDICNFTAMHYSCVNPECLQVLIDAGASLDVMDNDRYTPLMHCIMLNSPISFQKLIDAKASLDIVDKYGQTPLIKCCRHYSINEKYKDMVFTLIDNGAHLDTRDNDGKTALDYCKLRKEGYLRLIRAGASFNPDDVLFITEVRKIKKDEMYIVDLLKQHLSPDIVDHIVFRYLYTKKIGPLPLWTTCDRLCTIT